MSKLVRVRCTNINCFKKSKGYFLMTPEDMLKSITKNNGRFHLPCGHFANYYFTIPTTLPDNNKIINCGFDELYKIQNKFESNK